MAMAMGVRIKSQSRMGINPQVCRPAFHSMLDNRPAGMEFLSPATHGRTAADTAPARAHSPFAMR